MNKWPSLKSKLEHKKNVKVLFHFHKKPIWTIGLKTLSIAAKKFTCMLQNEKYFFVFVFYTSN